MRSSIILRIQLKALFCIRLLVSAGVLHTHPQTRCTQHKNASQEIISIVLASLAMVARAMLVVPASTSLLFPRGKPRTWSRRISRRFTARNQIKECYSKLVLYPGYIGQREEKSYVKERKNRSVVIDVTLFVFCFI